MPVDLLRDDCTRCAALCCMAHAFDAGAAFAIDKPAGLGCRHLATGGRCGIHGRRRAAGFSGCVGYSCHGAGQRVTQDCFGGRTWQDEPALTGAMMLAFQNARRLHGWLLLLTEAQKLPLPAAARAKAQALVAQLTPPGRMTEAWLAETASPAQERAVMAFLSSLREVARNSLASHARRRA